MEQQAEKLKGREVHILFADDDDDDIEITLMAFKEAKLKNKVFVARDGQEVIDYLWHLGKFQNQTEFPLPDIMLLDINMPKMNGIESMNRILSEHRKIPIIINTAYSSYKDNFMSWSADAYIIKSSDLRELKSKIKELIG